MTDAEAVKLLRNCKSIASYLNNQGINAPLSVEDKNSLLEFNKILAIYAKEMRFFADRAGIALHELGTLRVRANIEYERSKGVATCLRCGCDKFEGEHHYLCQEASFTGIPDDLMHAIIDRVLKADVENRKPLCKAS